MYRVHITAKPLCGILGLLLVEGHLSLSLWALGACDPLPEGWHWCEACEEVAYAQSPHPDLLRLSRTDL